jgi:catechol 2,3-dioxygenase-like lactoylglutathione lyase family enzyme
MTIGPETMEGEMPVLKGAVPILFVRDVTAAADFYAAKLGFAIDFLHGAPPFYGAVSRDGACLHLRFVQRPNFAELAAREESLILATIEVSDVAGLFAEYEARDVDFAQTVVRQPWGGTDFQVRDPDGNCVSFVEFGATAEG